MIRSGPSRAAAIGLALALAGGLGGCVTLFPKAQPEQLYRFGGEPPEAAPAAGTNVTVRSAGLGFDREAGTDRILTVRGDTLAYVQGARWAIPAQQIFEAEVERGFGVGGPVRFIPRGAPGHAPYTLRLEVMRFEARYQGASTAPPTILVRLRATLTRESDATLAGERVFEASEPAKENRIGAMVAAFDQATSTAIGDMVSWVGQTATPVAG